MNKKNSHSTRLRIPDGKPLLIINEDNDHYFKLSPELMTEQSLAAFVDEMTSGGCVTHIFFCPFGQRASYASNVVEPIWAGIDEPDQDGKTHNIWCVNAKTLHDKGIDPYEIWLKRSRERGVSPWLSMRMNDLHFITTENYFRTCTFWRQHPELRRTQKPISEGGWNDLAFDYSKEAVREFHFKVFKELVDRYAPDGIELDWMRFTQHLTPGHEREQAHFITEFIEMCREYATDAADRIGHPVSLSVRVPTLPETAFELGLDAEQWAAEGLVDLIVVTNFYASNDYAIPLDEWNRLIGNVAPDVPVIPCATNRITSNSALPNIEMGLEYYNSWGCLMYNMGAKGIYLFNAEYLEKETKAVIHGQGMGHERLLGGSRRFPVTYHDCAPDIDMADMQLPCVLSQDRCIRVHLADICSASKITLVLGFKEKDVDFAKLSVKLNQKQPEGKAIPCGNPGQFGGDETCRSAFAYSFSSMAARNGLNHVRIQRCKDESTLVWCEIIDSSIQAVSS